MPREAAFVTHQLPGQLFSTVSAQLLLKQPSPFSSPALPPTAESPNYPLAGAFFSRLK